MQGNVVQLPNTQLAEFDRWADLTQRLSSVIAIFNVLHEADLLSPLHECEAGGLQNVTAVNLLALAERELIALWTEARIRSQYLRAFDLDGC